MFFPITDCFGNPALVNLDCVALIEPNQDHPDQTSFFSFTDDDPDVPNCIAIAREPYSVIVMRLARARQVLES